MAGDDLGGLIATLNQATARALAAAVADIQARFLGYETAIVVLIDALDKTGALPIGAARSALGAAAEAMRDDAPNAPARAVLQRLTTNLRPGPPRGRPH